MLLVSVQAGHPRRQHRLVLGVGVDVAQEGHRLHRLGGVERDLPAVVGGDRPAVGVDQRLDHAVGVTGPVHGHAPAEPALGRIGDRQAQVPQLLPGVDVLGGDALVLHPVLAQERPDPDEVVRDGEPLAVEDAEVLGLRGGLAVLGRQRLDDVRHVLQVAQRLELRDEPRVGHERQVTRHAALDLGVDLGHHVTGVGLDQTVLDLRPGGVGELLDRAVERLVRRRPSTASATAPPSRSPSTTPRRRSAPSEPPPAPWGSTSEVSPHAARPAAPSTPTPIPRKPRRDHNGLSSMDIRLLRLRHRCTPSAGSAYSCDVASDESDSRVPRWRGPVDAPASIRASDDRADGGWR